MPQHERARVRYQIGLVRWQHGAQEPQVLKLAELAERCPRIIIQCECECRVATKHTQKNKVIVIEQAAELAPLEEYSVQGVAANEALVVPDRDEAAIVALRSPGKPVRVLTPLAASIDKRTCEDIVVLHSSTPRCQASTRRSLPESAAARSVTAKALDARAALALSLDFACRADFHIQRVRILHVSAAAIRTDREKQFIAARNAV